MDRLRTMNSDCVIIQHKKDNTMALLFWTCLQLERLVSAFDIIYWKLKLTKVGSDILAELPLPHSGLLAYEQDMPYPNVILLGGEDGEGFSEAVLGSYQAQLYLRKHLNSIHKMFYAPSAGPPENLAAIISHLQ